MKTPDRPRVALWHRYGAGDHVTCGGHAIPLVIERLAAGAEVHYFGMRGPTPVPASIRRHATLHTVPFLYDRSTPRAKFASTILWYLALPWIGLWCRFKRVRAVYIDETLPLTAWLAHWFYGGPVAMTVQDFFFNIYMGEHPRLAPLVRVLNAWELASWRRLAVVYTKVDYAHGFLAGHGIDPARLHTVYNPCNRAVFHPADRAAARRRLGFDDGHLVLVHHGILHPNKGNDRVIRALAGLRERLPALRFLLIGNGPAMPGLRRLVAELGLEDIVRLPGWMPTEADLNAALNAGDIGLVMRIGQVSDHFHLTDTLSHEMACGLPILAARLHGVAEVLRDGEDAYLFDPACGDEFTQRLTRLAEDPDLRRRFGAASLRISAEVGDVARAADRILAPLQPLIGS